MEFPLTKNQQEAFDSVLSSSQNFFITGKPGVGKSVLINALVSSGLKHFTLAAPTGLAALNIGGKTLHSIFRIPMFEGIIEPDYNEFPKDDRVISNIKYNIHHLIIDEISMVRVDQLDYIDRYLRLVKEDDAPFGGIQLIIVGDFYQLPPVTNSASMVQLRQAGYETHFAFSSKVFDEANFQIIELNEVLRQKGDPSFINILHAARIGKVTLPQCAKLNKNIGEANDLRIMLCGQNKQADQINQGHLIGIAGEPVVFNATEYGMWPAFPVEKELKLKIGAQVMVRLNSADRKNDDRDLLFESKVVNGTLGKITAIFPDRVEIEKENGDIVPIYIKRWERKVKEKNIHGKYEEKVVASYQQIPLSLAWAISIHKSQGQSFDKVHINPKVIFAPGQLYVALSRGRSLKGLKFSSPVESRKFWTDSNVVKFYKKLKIA